MIRPAGPGDGSPWIAVVRRVPAQRILSHVHAVWQAFVTDCTARGISLQKWDEPKLTKALLACLSAAAINNGQPFDGDFVAELERFELDPVTFAPICVARTDIEWLLSGFPRFIIEFKLLDGTPQLRTRYWQEGLGKFIRTIYAPRSAEAAMWGFLRSPGTGDPARVMALLGKRAKALNLVDPAKPCLAPSVLAPGLAHFDTAHHRSTGPSPLGLAHIFTPLP